MHFLSEFSQSINIVKFQSASVDQLYCGPVCVIPRLKSDSDHKSVALLISRAGVRYKVLETDFSIILAKSFASGTT